MSAEAADPVLGALAEAVAADGGLTALAVVPPPEGARAEHGAVAAAGPRAAGHEDEYALLVEAIREGYLLHYGAGRVVRPVEADLALLAGDQLYALGLARLAALGDLEGVTELADLIALAASAQAAREPGLAEAAWAAGAAAVGFGGDEGHRAAKDAARRGAPGAADALRTAARRLAGTLAPDR